MNLVTAFVFSIVLSSPCMASTCAVSCSCRYLNVGMMMVKCSPSSSDEIFNNLPNSLPRLQIELPNVLVIRENDFSKFIELISLKIIAPMLKTIDDKAFNNLIKLSSFKFQDLFLSNNKI